MMHVFCKLVPPRPSFAADMSDDERAAMMRHGAYWTKNAVDGLPMVVGLVGDPQGAWGVGILEVRDEEHLRGLLDNDPAVLSIPGIRYEWHPMPRGVIHRPFTGV